LAQAANNRQDVYQFNNVFHGRKEDISINISSGMSIIYGEPDFIRTIAYFTNVLLYNFARKNQMSLLSVNPPVQDTTDVEKATAVMSEKSNAMKKAMDDFLLSGTSLKKNKDRVREFCCVNGFDYNELLTKNLELREEVKALKAENVHLKGRII